MAGITNETDITVRLPKPDTKYHYYTNTGAVSGQSVTLDRTHSYKLAYIPNASGDMEVTLTVKNEVNAGIVGFDNNTTGFLFGNPTMAYIDMFKLMDANPKVLSHVGYQVMTGDKYTTVLRAAGTTDHYLAPMQSAIVLPLSKTKSITLKIPANCLVLNPYAPTGSVQPAPRRAMGHTFRSDRMDIMVYSDGGKGSAILLARDFADNAYNVEEDMLYNAAGFGADKNRLQTMTPVNVYTLAGNMPLAADVREKIGVVPLGFEIDNAYRQDSIDIFFSLNSVWSEECYFCDSETGERWRIYNDTHIRIATPANHEIRYYIQGEYNAPENPDTPTQEPNTTINSDASTVSAFSTFAETVVVVASEDIAEIRMYDIAGRLLQEIAPANNTPILTLQAPTGVVLLSTRLRSGFMTQTKVLVK